MCPLAAMLDPSKQRNNKMPLTRSTQIPTHARGKVRALVKAHKHWPVFLRKKSIISASARNADLIEFALYYPELVAGIEALISPAVADASG